MEPILIDPAEVMARAAAVGMSIPDLTRQAGVNRSVFYRWRNGDYSIGTRNYRKIITALHDAERDYATRPLCSVS